MPQYFQAQPLDFGANILANGYANAGNTIAGAFRQNADRKADTENLKLRASIESQQRQDAIQQELDNQAISGWQTAFGDKPMPTIKDAAGKDRPNRAVINKMVDDWKGTDAIDQATRQKDALFRQDVGTKAAGYGIPTTATKTIPAMGPDDSEGGTATTFGARPFADIAKDVQSRATQDQLDKYTQERATAAAAGEAKTNAERNAKLVDEFGQMFSRAPQGDEIDASGHLTPKALNAVYAAKNQQLKGYMPDASKPGAVIPIPGGPAEAKLAAAAQVKADADASQAKKIQMAEDGRTMVLENIDKALPLIDKHFTTGNVGGSDFVRALPWLGQDSQDLHASLDAIKAGLGVDQLNEMRASSKTGSTGIGRIMQVEFEAFAKAARNLDQKQSDTQLRQNLIELQTHLKNWKAAKAANDKGQGVAQSILDKYGVK